MNLFHIFSPGHDSGEAQRFGPPARPSFSTPPRNRRCISIPLERSPPFHFRPKPFISHHRKDTRGDGERERERGKLSFQRCRRTSCGWTWRSCGGWRASPSGPASSPPSPTRSAPSMPRLFHFLFSFFFFSLS